MEQNYQNPEKQIIAKSIRPRRFPKFFWTSLAIFLVLFGIGLVKAYNFGSKVFVNHSSFASKISNVIFSGSNSTLKGESAGRINILLLGYGGEGHDGPFLTDTIILASIDPDKHQVSLSSIPRDYYWPAGNQKINYAFFKGYDKNKNVAAGGELAMQAVAQMTGLDIAYFATIDFSGFEKAVDRIGGLDINVERTFTDSQYPNDANYGYIAPITFTAGSEHMNGQRALQFARSRHGSNQEDSDFARSKRQAKIIDAFKAKLQQLGILSNAGTINDLLDILADHAHTNIDPSELLHLAKILREQKNNITSQSLDLESNLICPANDAIIGYILNACPGVSSQQIQTYFQNSFANSAVRAENATIILENAGASKNDFEDFKKQLAEVGLMPGVNIFEVPYKGLPLQASALYQTADKPATIKYLQELLGVSSQPKPETMIAKTDIVIFLTK